MKACASVMDECLLCPVVDENVTTKKVTSVGEKGAATLLTASIERGDNLHVVFEQFLTDVKTDKTKKLTVHTKCRQYYVEPNRISKAKKRQADLPSSPNSPVKRRSCGPSFDIRVDCLYCGVNKENQKKKQFSLYSVRCIEYLDNLNKKIDERNDKWAHEVRTRVSNYSDLVAAEAKYHQNCMSSFYKNRIIEAYKTSVDKVKVGRPPDKALQGLFDKLCKFLEENDECQYTLKELVVIINAFKDDDNISVSEKWLQGRLEGYYGDEIVIVRKPGLPNMVCFKDFAHKVLRENWKDQCVNPEDEKFRVLAKAAAYILDDVRTMIFDLSKFSASPSIEEIEKLVPASLLYLLEGIIKTKSRDKTIIRRRILSIAHAIISSARPRSFVSPLLLAITVYIHQNFASKELISLLSSLAFAENYTELRRLHEAMLKSGQVDYNLDGFVQFIFDNADFNISTLTGHGTFHSLGGLACTTPLKPAILKGSFERSIQVSSVDSKSFPRIPYKRYSKKTKIGLSSVTVEPIELQYAEFIRRGKNETPRVLDLLWASSFGRELSRPVPNWNGFMQVSIRSREFEQSNIQILPFINLNPNDLSTIYTALIFAQKLCNQNNLLVAPVTFDQPLYMKAADIIAACSDEFKSLFARLGGFHWLMSAMGSVGYIMNGSGLETLFETVYAKGSIHVMMSGHAYARAFRAHLLASTACLSIFLEESPLDFSHNDTSITELFDGNSEYVDISRKEEMLTMADAISNLIDTEPSRSRTIKLWKLYLRLCHLLRLFVFAERSGNFSLHLQIVEMFIPIFHASGHFPYAKSSRIYLEQMKSLKSKMPEKEFDLFCCKGYFTIRRKEKFFGGNFSDIVIEQDLMRLFKSSGGMTRGRGITDSTISTFVSIMPQCIPISNFLEEFTGVSTLTSEQHKDLRQSNLDQDAKDLDTFLNWFKSYSPLAYRNMNSLVCLVTGRVAQEEVNCDDAFEVGMQAASSMNGKIFTDVQLKHKDKVISFAASNNKLNVRGREVSIDPNILWHRLSIVINNSSEKESCFTYELAQEPPSLFKDGLMRKTQKSQLGVFVKDGLKSIDNAPENCTFVVDGGYLLRKVIWADNSTYEQIFLEYVNFILRHFGSDSVVVFDGYKDLTRNTKYHEQCRRASNACSKEIIFQPDMVICISQKDFLANRLNKAKLIEFCKTYFEMAKIGTTQAKGDADSLIVKTVIGLEKRGKPVVMVGNDTDLLIILMAQASTLANIYIMTEVNPTKIMKICDLQGKYSEEERRLLMAMHYMTGSDTTSSFFGKGKSKAYKMPLEKSKELTSFLKNDATVDEIVDSGEKYIVSLYGGMIEKGINRMRYERYNLAIKKSNLTTNFKLESLPPTSAALKQHSFRVYHAIQQAMGNDIDATIWGWELKEDILWPKKTDNAVAPERLLKLISCGCKTGCQKTALCTCKRFGIECTSLCSGCNGQTCANVTLPDDDL